MGKRFIIMDAERCAHSIDGGEPGASQAQKGTVVRETNDRRAF